MKAIIIGDVVGKPGRRVLAETVKDLKQSHGA